MNRLNVKTLTPELLAGPTFELMKGTCKSLTELEYFCEEVYKATTKKLDWINPRERQSPMIYTANYLVLKLRSSFIPFHHFINNDLEYLHGGVSSRKYSTSVTKTMAADYGHIKWIEDLVPNSMWSQMIVKYDKFALWGISNWGKKRRQLYAFATTRESARDVYSKRRLLLSDARVKGEFLVIMKNSQKTKDKEDNAKFGDICGWKTIRGFNTTAGNPVKKILLKLNLSDHRSKKEKDPHGSEGYLKVVECQSVKVKEFQERCNIKAFQEWYEHVGPEVASPQDGKVTRWRRDCAWLMISRCSRSQCQIQVQGTSSIQEVNDHYNIFTRESQEYELKTKDKA
ncbi:hypothetical protein Tco_0010601 [Tanacetum coccineum]